ncbi:MAG TPA: ABC transporter ATP-binding protein [Microthrixaceae bacterium]|nr:ABC transporter ATP-binding protein [Microthrixaceae bacterium]
MTQLEVQDVGVHFGGVVALDGLSFSIDKGQICALIGPNGAGKTTLFNVVSRLYVPTSGSVHFEGQDLLAMAPHRIVEVGVARTFQNLALVPGLSVLDNVKIGAHSKSHAGFWTSTLRLPQVRSEEKRLTADAMGILERLNLAQFAKHPCGGLPYGTLKRIEFARALASQPKLLMLDEPASGLTHGEVDELGLAIQQIRDEFDLTILLVEHHMSMVMSISHKVVVMDLGRRIAVGAPAEIRDDPLVIAAYLGAPAK